MKNSINSDACFELIDLIRQVRESGLDLRARELQQFGITNERARALYVVKSLGDRASPKLVSRWLFRETHSVYELLRRMKNDGLVDMVKLAGKKGTSIVILTKEGEKLYRQISERESYNRTVSVLSEKEQGQLRLLLTKLRDRMINELGKDYDFPYLR